MINAVSLLSVVPFLLSHVSFVNVGSLFRNTFMNTQTVTQTLGSTSTVFLVWDKKTYRQQNAINLLQQQKNTKHYVHVT